MAANSECCESNISKIYQLNFIILLSNFGEGFLFADIICFYAYLYTIMYAQ